MCRLILDSDKRIPRCWDFELYIYIYIYKVGWTCSSSVFRATLESVPIYIYIEPRPRLRATTAVYRLPGYICVFPFTGGGELTYFQLLKLLNPSRLRAPILPSFFIPCLKPSSHSWSRGGSDRSSFTPSCSCIPISISERLVKIRGFESSLSLFFSFLSCIRIVRYFSRIFFSIVFPGTNDRIDRMLFHFVRAILNCK